MNIENNDKESALRIHRAKWVLPVSSPPIPNGAVATFGGRIIEVGRADSLNLRFHGQFIDHGEVILCPGLVNAHSHIELAPLKYRLEPCGSFTGWIKAILTARSKIKADELEPAVEMAIDEMNANGIIAIGDTGNTQLVLDITSKSRACSIKGVFFKEILHHENDPMALANDWLSFTDMTSACFKLTISAHAPYTVSPETIRIIKSISRLRKRPFSIHLAESIDEVELLTKKDGPLKKLLQERGRWPLPYLPGVSPVSYISSLNVLDKDTICVHCVHLNDQDIEILAKSGATVCLCPRSNFFLGVGIAPVESLVKAGIPIAIGTDSLASNDRLSIFSEMASLARIAPGLSSETIFRAATYDGAKALGLDKDIGTLSKGKTSTFLAVSAKGITDHEVYDFLTSGCEGPDMDCYLING